MAGAPITARPHVFNLRPAPGWLEVLFQEVESLAKNPLQKYKFAPNVTLLKSTVKLHRCDWRQGLEILMRVTTAHDMEWVILDSKCSKWSEVDAILERVPWDEVLPNRNVKVHVTADVEKGFTSNSAKLRENLCRIAKVEHVSEGAEIRLKIELRGEILRISASLAGEPLYKRGYKARLEATAPLTEHQAAACTRWVLSQTQQKVSSVYVPFAGSGTFGFESLVVLSEAGPGSFTRKFACELFPCTPQATIGFLKRKLSERLSTVKELPITFVDFNVEVISVLKENTAHFPTGKLTVQCEDIFKVKPVFPTEGKILILLNPPYGDRLAYDSDIANLYGRLGQYLQTLSKEYPGRIVGGCICPDVPAWSDFLKSLFVDSAETHHFTHGGKEMRLVRWQA